MPLLRPITTEDIDDVLALNHRNVVKLAPLDAPRLDEIRGWADRVDVVVVDDRFAGFVVTFQAGTPYDSDKYEFFSDRFGDDFYYLDRIVLHEDFRRRGLGSFVYDEVEQTAREESARMALEVNLVPRNDASLAFHQGRGYVEVGRLGDAEHLVSMMTKTWSGA